MRGGGGGTFGIATRMVYKAHDAFPNYLHYNADFYAKPTDCNDCRNTMLEAFNEFVAYTEEHQPGQWGGYVRYMNGSDATQNYDVLSVMSLMFIGE